MAPSRLFLFLALLGSLCACQSDRFPPPAREDSGRSLVVAAIAARGGPLKGTVRHVRGEVGFGYPGSWDWSMVVCARDFFRWEIPAAGAVQAWEQEGGEARRFLGSAELPRLAAGSGEVAAAARFLRTADLDALLRTPGVELARVAPGEGAVAALRVRWPDGPASWKLGFDRRGLVVSVEGPFDAPFTGPVTLRLERAGFAKTGDRLLPLRETFRIGENLLADTEIRQWEVLLPGDQRGPCTSVSSGPTSSRSSR